VPDTPCSFVVARSAQRDTTLKSKIKKNKYFYVFFSQAACLACLKPVVGIYRKVAKAIFYLNFTKQVTNKLEIKHKGREKSGN
jgi:recombinational DNA repair protein (RecF pathway)